MSFVIKVDSLTKKFNDFTAVNNLSFTVNKGDVYGFLGQNGAGKSTTIRMLLTLIKPTSGTIEIFSQNLSHSRTSILKNVGAVIEKPDLYKYLSAYDNLAIFAKMCGIKVTKQLLMQQLEIVGLAQRAKDKVETFSQGMKQRLGIAVALVHNPDLVILDEPTNGLDPQGITDIRNLILSLSKQSGKTVVVSSHLLSEIELVANRMIIIHQGKKIVEGSVAELLDPSKALIQLQTTNDVFAKQQLAQTKWAVTLQADDDKLKLIMPKNEVPQLVKELVSKNVDLLSISPMHALENYFLSLTNNMAHVESVTN